MIDQHLSALVDRLCAEGIVEPLAQSFTLAALWDDLAAIADEPLPAAVRAVLGDAPRPQTFPPGDTLQSPARSCQGGDAR